MAVTLLNARVSAMTETDLRFLTGMADNVLRAFLWKWWVSRGDWKGLLKFRRDIQEVLTKYSKSRPAIGRLDRVQGKSIWVCKEIERAAGDAFRIPEWRKIKAQNPHMTLTERVGRKHKIKTEWEKLLRTYSY